MSRVRRLAHALASGYVALGANTVFTLASVPLAWSWLPKPEFGLWALTVQMASYVALIDIGMAGSSRILIDHKDQRNGGDYGSVIQTMLWVSLVQGLLILGLGLAAGFALPGLVGVPPELHRLFFLLSAGQCLLLAGTFLSRLFNFLLAAHQRHDLINYSQAGSFIVNYAVMAWAFARGQGVFSMLWGQLAGWVFFSAVCGAGCLRLGLFPAAGHWGRSSWVRFRELFDYGRDIFVFFLASQLVMASQTILVSRTLGLEAAAVWSVGTRAFQLLVQMVYRFFDYSCPALAEMIVREERDLLQRRFRSVVAWSAAVGVLAASLYAACNQPFVTVWTSGKVSWPASHDLLLAAWLAMSVLTHAHAGLIGQAKQFRLLPWLYLAEGVFFVGLSLWLLPRGGVGAMLAASLVSGLLFTFPYGLWRTSGFFGVPVKVVGLEWIRPAIMLFSVLVPATALVWLWTRGWSAPARLAVNGGVLGALGVWLFLRLGIEDSLRRELISRCPAWCRGALLFLCGSGSGRVEKGKLSPSGEPPIK